MSPPDLVHAGLEVEQVETPGHDVSGPVVLGRSSTSSRRPTATAERFGGVKSRSARPTGTCAASSAAAELLRRRHRRRGSRRRPSGLPDLRSPDLRPCLRRHDLLGSRARTGRRPHRHHRPAAVGAAAAARLEMPSTCSASATACSTSRSHPTAAIACRCAGSPRGGHRVWTCLRDPADILPRTATTGGHPVVLDDPFGCDRFVARTISGIDPTASSPLWMRRRLQLAGMRPISLVVDVTNYVMLETGQPIHAYDRALLSALRARRAAAGETLQTLDSVTRHLDPDDLLSRTIPGRSAWPARDGGNSTEISH